MLANLIIVSLRRRALHWSSFKNRSANNQKWFLYQRYDKYLNFHKIHQPILNSERLTGFTLIVFDKKTRWIRTKLTLFRPTLGLCHQVGTFLYHKETSLSSSSSSCGVKSSLLTPKSSRIEVSTASLKSIEATKTTFLLFNRSNSINLVGKLVSFVFIFIRSKNLKLLCKFAILSFKVSFYSRICKFGVMRERNTIRVIDALFPLPDGA